MPNDPSRPIVEAALAELHQQAQGVRPADPTREADAETEYAVIHVKDGPAESWPVVERVPGGWQSGAHHYPDADVLRVTPLRLAPPGAVVVPAEHVDVLTDALSECTFWACKGPTLDPEPMVTCNSCYATAIVRAARETTPAPETGGGHGR